MTGAASRGIAGPAGSGNGVPSARTSRRCSSYEADTATRYSVSAATLARIASCVKLLLMASAAMSTAYVTIATCGVWKRGCTPASAACHTPSRPNAYRQRRKPDEIGVDVPEPCADEHQQRQELRHGHRLHEPRAEDDAADVDGGQHGDQRDQHDRASGRAGHRRPQCADRPGKGACDGGD